MGHSEQETPSPPAVPEGQSWLVSIPAGRTPTLPMAARGHQSTEGKTPAARWCRKKARAGPGQAYPHPVPW